ncbi:MAG: hypothetical protein HGA36_05305 [Candidatus Moranbacteria bacterium]|nr:hypothetical protein [Candidatus Moranbacteria bacterium]
MQKNTKKIAFILAWALVVPVFVIGQVSFWQDMSKKANAADASDVSDDISDLQKKLDRERKAKEKLEQSLGQIQGAVALTQKDINTTKSVITETVTTISRKESEVQNLNNKIELQKNMLRGLLRQVYYNQGQPILNVVLTSQNFSDAFSDTDHLLTIEDRIKELSGQISETRSQVEQDKMELALAKEKHEDILDDKLGQKQELVADQVDVQGDIEDKNVIISKLQKQLVELQGDLNALSGKSYNAKDIREAVEIASRGTGVPEGVLYGFLKMETNLGANTGKCTYKQVIDVALPRYKVLLKKSSKWQASIDTLYRREKLFYALVDDLGYDKNKKVSCSPPPSSYIGQGGAMGIPQFMSDVWNSYSARISANTGHKTPDPWEITDGVMAMAIKLRNAGATSSSASVIRKASINYLGTFNNNYYSGIVYWSKNYKLLFN